MAAKFFQSRLGKTIKWLGLVLVALPLLAIVLFDVFKVGSVALPPPVAERDVQFNLGSKEFDPVNVGYENDKLTGGFVMDTTLAGNLNTGHEFRDIDPETESTSSAWVKGVLGPALTHDERMALIEYMKSL